jgi:integrase
MSLTNAVERYVALKQAVGYRFKAQRSALMKFGAYAEAAGDQYVSANRLVAWAATAPSAQSSRYWFSIARSFAIAMHAEDDRHEVPPRDVFGRRKRSRPRPHQIDVGDIARIMDAALTLPPLASLTPYTYHYLIGLIATTGLRVSEAVELLVTDVTADGLRIRESKFRKSRLVPIDASTRKALGEYQLLRRRIGGRDPHCFVLSTGEPPDRASVTRAFIKLARQLGVRGATGRGVRLHDLRHSFAMRSLERCGNEPTAIKRHMLALSTYLGHACLSDTYWYLEATPVLTRQVARVAESFHTGGAP